jgi:hypothetical protein
MVHEEGHAIAAKRRRRKPARRYPVDDVAPTRLERLIQRVLAGDLHQSVQMLDGGSEILIGQYRPPLGALIHGSRSSDVESARFAVRPGPRTPGAVAAAFTPRP